MKICSKCHKEKPDSDFSFRNKVQGTRQHECKICVRERANKHYADNKDYYKMKARRYDKNIAKINQEHLVEYLANHPCVDCGEKDPIVLEFDHVRGKKKEAVSIMVAKSCSWQTIEKEIKKCDVRCANCHKRRTAQSRNYWKVRLP